VREAKPIGPVSLEELHARRLSGLISPETYVIEHTGQPNESPTWKRYREIFPVSPSQTLPPLPSAPFVSPPAPNLIAPPPPHPLFPSASLPPLGHAHPLPSGPLPGPHYYPTRKINTWCGWGFGLGLAATFLTFACGIGALVAIPAFLICIMGLVQVHRNREQAGQGLAIAGLVLSGIALLLSLIFILTLAIPFIKEHEKTTTEQTSNSSE